MRSGDCVYIIPDTTSEQKIVKEFSHRSFVGCIREKIEDYIDLSIKNLKEEKDIQKLLSLQTKDSTEINLK